MIKINLYLTLMFFLGIPIITILISWFYLNKYIKKEEKRNLDLIECEVCFNVYEDKGNSTISICPRCGSYNKRR